MTGLSSDMCLSTDTSGNDGTVILDGGGELPLLPMTTPDYESRILEDRVKLDDVVIVPRSRFARKPWRRPVCV